MVVLLRLTACSTSLLIGLTSRCFAHWARASCAPATAILNSQWSFRIFAPPSPSAVRCSVAAHCASLRVLATPALRASDVRPSLAHWAYYGLFPPQAAAFVRPSPVSAEILWISGRGNCKEAIFALENGIFRRGVLRVHAPLNSAWSSHCARRLACGTPCFIGLTTACFRHWRRPSCAPAVHAAGDD